MSLSSTYTISEIRAPLFYFIAWSSVFIVYEQCFISFMSEGMHFKSPFPKYVCSVVRSLSVTLANACKFRIFIFLFLPAQSVIIVFVSSVVKIARFFLVFSASVVNIRTSLIQKNAWNLPDRLVFHCGWPGQLQCPGGGRGEKSTSL